MSNDNNMPEKCLSEISATDKIWRRPVISRIEIAQTLSGPVGVPVDFDATPSS
jgi:hypothetical protein